MSGPDYEISPKRTSEIFAIRDRIKGDSGPAQCNRLLTILREVGPVSTFELSRFADIYYSPSRKFELKAEGHNIITTRRTIRTESGALHSLGVYSLVAGTGIAG